ncbi:MAG: hypothetical protein MJZ86_01530 [Bacteroidales bacterium]|nr:hypothetical protein [Bacteroidales bacterium]
MKRLFALAIAASLAFAGCQREEGEVVFEASLAHNNTKISMDANNFLAWEEGDLVRISDQVTGTVFEVHTDNANHIAHLHQKLQKDNSHQYRNSTNYFAIYPGPGENSNNYISSTNTSAQNIFFRVNSIGNEQIVTNDRHYDKDWLVCTAANRGSAKPSSGTRTVHLQFHNCMALLKCTITEGCTNICQLKVTASTDDNGAPIGGHAWVSTSDAGVDLTCLTGINNTDRKYDITLRKEDNTALTPGEYYIAIWSDYYNSTSTSISPSMNTSDYLSHTTKKNVTITPCNASGTAIEGYGSYTVDSYSFFRNTIYPVGTFPKTSKESKEASIFH